MNINKRKNKFIAAFFIYIIGFLWLLVVSSMLQTTEEALKLFNTCIIAYLIIGACILAHIVSNGGDVFEPLTVITILYALLFVFEPMIDIYEENLSWFGGNYTVYGVKGTWIAIIGYISFFIGYKIRRFRVMSTRKHYRNLLEKSRVDQYENVQYYAKVGIIFWIVCYILSVMFLLLSGKSLVFILTGGMTGSGELLETRKLLGALSMFSYSLVGAWMLYFVYGKKRPLKIITFILTIFIYYIRGYRFIIIIFVLAPIVFLYLLKNKRPKLIAIIGAVFIMILFVGFVAVARNSVRYGGGVSSDMLNWEAAFEQVKDNFRIYKTYYALVDYVPEKTSFLHGRQIFLYTALMFVPRLIWRAKPDTADGLYLIKKAVSNSAFLSGTAYPIIGEYYIEFGILGVIILMFLYGYLNKNWLKKYGYSTTKIDLIMYSILLLSNFQIVIRGYTPSNFYMVIFFVLPIVLIKMNTRKNKIWKK